MDIQARLAELHLTLPEAPQPVAEYVSVQQSGKHIFVSGQGPLLNGQMKVTGKLGKQVTLEAGQEAARICVLNALAQVNHQLKGDWSRFVKVAFVRVFIASDNEFFAQPQVANGASELLVKIFGEPGRHTRSALGVNVLPMDISVELELVVEVA